MGRDKELGVHYRRSGLMFHVKHGSSRWLVGLVRRFGHYRGDVSRGTLEAGPSGKRQTPGGSVPEDACF